jgi:hypothetical protein
MDEKTRGQIAYEENVRRNPLNHDGTKSKTWDQLTDVVRWSWESAESRYEIQEAEK